MQRLEVIGASRPIYGSLGVKRLIGFYSDFSFFMQLYRMKHLKCLRTRKYSLEHKCELNLSLV